MLMAVISDIHSNLEALQAVLKDIEQQEISDIICLGDVIGYGTNPDECIDIIRKCKVTIMGNHDEGMIDEPAVGFTLRARQALDWTREKLKPNWLSSKEKKERWKFLVGLLATKEIDDIFCVHGSPRQPTTEYILRTDCDPMIGSGKLDEIFSMFKSLCFVGHTHDPGIIPSDQYRFCTPKEIDYTYEVKEGVKLIVNVGSVGQPRDSDNRACYITFDGKVIKYRRVEYDYNKTAEKIFKIPQLERYFGERLALGR